jgi:alanine racemase
VDAHRVWAEVDLDALTDNLACIRSRLAPRVAVVLVVKADAYGHGAVATAHHALRCGVQALGVGTSAEALELRAAGVRAPILVLGTIVDEEATACLRHGVDIALHSLDRARMLQELGRRLGAPARVHVKVDTGMGRLGVLPGRALDLLQAVRSSSHLVLRGLMTHVAAPQGANAVEAVEQLTLFESVLRRARERALVSGWVHAANSACIFTGLGTAYDAVRPGISAYGVLPEGVPGSDQLRPVLSLHSQVVFLKDVPAGARIGYAGTWSAPRPTRIATLPVGYNDGLPWRLGNQGEVLVRGRRAPIVGRVSMDYTTVDVGHIPGVEVGDRATLIGVQGGERIALEELAGRAGTIPYEITCAVGKRVERLYRGGEDDPLAQDDASRESERAAPAPRTATDPVVARGGTAR